MTGRARPRLSVRERVEVWDAALAAVDRALHDLGCREVKTPARITAVAVEPWIEPLPAGDAWLRTSPELALKRLRCAGAEGVYEVATVFRGDEHGRWHRPSFHLVEWLRPGDSLETLAGDVEHVVSAIESAVRGALGVRVEGDGALGRARVEARTWETWTFHAAFAHSTQTALAGDEDADGLLAAVGPSTAATLGPRPTRDACARAVAAVGLPPSAAADLEDLWAWTALWTVWSDGALASWRASADEPRRSGLHLSRFPRALASLAVVEGKVALRCESMLSGLEIANGYVESTDADAIERGFRRANALRVLHDRAPLPIDEDFVARLRESPLPASIGVALGLERTLAAAFGAAALDELLLADEVRA